MASTSASRPDGEIAIPRSDCDEQFQIDIDEHAFIEKCAVTMAHATYVPSSYLPTPDFAEIEIMDDFARNEQHPALLPRWLTRQGARESFMSLKGIRRRWKLVFMTGLLVAIAATYFRQDYSRHDLAAYLPSAITGGSLSLFEHKILPFDGAFAKFPSVSQLSLRQRRITIVAIWNGNGAPGYLRHWFYTVQLNADSVDVLFINRLHTDNDTCLDFAAEGIDTAWGGNLRSYCMSEEEWNRRHVDFLCSPTYGWNCNATEYDAVAVEWVLPPRQDPRNAAWRPIQGLVFRDLMPRADTAFWAYMDSDSMMGDFRRYPFNVLSQVSLLTSNNDYNDDDSAVYLGGQLTAWNLDDKDLSTAWKRFPGLKSPSHFTQYLEGRMPQQTAEHYWSWGYLGSHIDDIPGAQLSYAMYQGLHGDDYYDNVWRKPNANQTFVISGRTILLISTSYTREEIEGLIELERNEPIDENGSLGWTGGVDGSSYLLESPDLTSLEAKQLALANAEESGLPFHAHEGIVEDVVLNGNCSLGAGRHCVMPHPLTRTDPPIMRGSLIRFKGQQPGHVLRRLEKDHRPRGYERKLIKHHQWAKRLHWYGWPPFDITEDLVLRINCDSVEVFKMGVTRNETLYYRKEREVSIG